MTESTWLAELKTWASRQAQDDDPAEQLALGGQELLAAVPDDKIRDAYLATDGEPGDPLADALSDEIAKRGIDL